MESNYPTGFGSLSPPPQSPHRPRPPEPLSGWATFMGVMVIIGGAISCITIIGAIVGVPYIIAGNKLLKAITASRELGGSDNDFKLSEVFTNVNSFFKIQGIVMIVAFGLWIIMIVVMLIFMAMGLPTMIEPGAGNLESL